MAREFSLEKLVISVSWLTSMLVKQLQLSVSLTTLVKSTKSVKLMKVRHKWTDGARARTWYHYHICCDNSSMEQPPQTSLTHQGTDFTIEVQRSLLVYWTVRLPLTHNQVLVLKLETVWRQATEYGSNVSYLPTKLTKSVLTSLLSKHTSRIVFEANAHPPIANRFLKMTRGIIDSDQDES